MKNRKEFKKKGKFELLYLSQISVNHPEKRFQTKKLSY